MTDQTPEQQLDAAYRERAQLLAWLAALVPSAITLAPDVDEPGWKLLFLHPSGGQLSWHISPRDDDLFEHVTRAVCDDPRVQWDGHTTAEKYERIRAITAARTTPDNPPTSGVPCSAHVLRRPHLAHGWEPQPGMTPAHCPGVQAASDAARFPGRATVTIAIHAPNQDNADRWANTIRDLVTAEHGHHMRLDITIQAGGNDGLREQYAAAIRAKVDGTEGCANGHRLADAVLAVRDAELARLRELVTIEEERAECHKRVAANWGQQLDTVTATLAAIRRYAQAFGPTGVLDILDGKAGQ